MKPTVNSISLAHVDSAGYCIQVSAGTAALLGIVSEAELGPQGH